MRLMCLLVSALLSSAGLTACTDSERGEAQLSSPRIREDAAKAMFVDYTKESGLEFTHLTFPTEARLLPEIIGAGVALFDYDNDGDLDVYFVQGGHPVDAPVQRLNANRLFRNDLISKTNKSLGRLSFTDVTQESGVDHAGYGMGVATGDYDNDGDVDLYVTNAGSNVLFRNEGLGRFANVTQIAGVDDDRWSASASFADFDNDGLLDLFVTNYVGGAVENNRPCSNPSGRKDYCSPTVFEPTSDSLFRNRGDGTFLNVSALSGIASSAAAGLGVIAADFDQDGDSDFFVANDQTANFLWRNNGTGHFLETGLLSGSAYNGHGMAEASMGVSAADFDGDGDEDLFMTHLRTQTNTLYVNNGDGEFVDSTDRARLDSASLKFTGFGSNWFDVDNDSDLDIFVANGTVTMDTAQIDISEFPYAQRNQLFVNTGGSYSQWRGKSGGALEALGVSRGSAVGDIDNDGDLDLLVANSNGLAQLLLNVHEPSLNWLGLALQGTQANRDGTGARIALLREGKAPLWRRSHSDGSYLSANDKRVHFGLGVQDETMSSNAVHLGVVWPGGKREQWFAVPTGRYSQLVEGTGEAWLKDTETP